MELTAVMIIGGVLMLLLGAASLIYAIRLKGHGTPVFGKRGVYVLLGFAFVGMGSLLALLGIFSTVPGASV